MNRRFRRARRSEPQDLNITAFMNLMVVLVPFLLITAVFSRITILELSLPGEASATAQNEEPFHLELIVRHDRIEVGDRAGGSIRMIPATDDGYDLAAVSGLLQQIKARYPERVDATLLLEADIPYDSLVQVMDTVRVADVVQGTELARAELFPEISIGDAPVLVAQRGAGG